MLTPQDFIDDGSESDEELLIQVYQLPRNAINVRLVNNSTDEGERLEIWWNVLVEEPVRDSNNIIVGSKQVKRRFWREANTPE